MRSTYLVAISLGLLLAALAHAQTPRPGTGQTPMPPQVPPPNTAHAQQRAGQTNLVPTMTFQRTGVPGALSLSTEQLNRLNEVTQGLQNRYRDEFGRLNSLREAERNQRALELQQQFRNDWMAEARNVFNEQQLNRYRQLHWQSLGFDAFSDAQVGLQLNLSDAQVRQLREASAWSQQQLLGIGQQAATNRADALRLYRAYQLEWQNRLNGVLNEQQQRAWGQMIGTPFEFTPPFLSDGTTFRTSPQP
jgi:hypothetical protein